MRISSHTTRRSLSLAAFLLMFALVQIASAYASPATVVRVEPQTSMATLGETFTVYIKLADVQNLWDLEVTLYWNSSVLEIIRIDVRLGVESYPDGVLHEALPDYRVFIAKNETNQGGGKYQLAATSTGRDTPSFSGSGNIVAITFRVLNVGSSQLNLETLLGDKPVPPFPSSPIPHTTLGGFFSSETPQPPVWQYVALLIVGVLVTAATATVVYSRMVKKPKKKLLRVLS